MAAQLGAFKAEVFLDVTGDEPAATRTSISESRITQKRMLLLLKEYPNDADILTYLALMNSDMETALGMYQEAVAIDSELPLAYSGMADVYYAQGRLDQHLKMAKRAYKLAPWKSIFQNDHANALGRKERYQDAIAVYENLVYADPQYLWAYSDLARLYRLTGDLQRSYSYGQQFIELTADEHVISLSRNEAALLGTGPNSDPVYIPEDLQKKYFGYYDIVLTSYLLGHTEEAKSYVNKAKDIQIDPHAESEIKRVLNYDIERLQEEQEQLRSEADEFITKFL
jgi:tetratricopeptide (TPR) repeat protein